MGIAVLVVLCVLVVVAVVTILPVEGPPFASPLAMASFLMTELPGQVVGLVAVLCVVLEVVGWPHGALGIACAAAATAAGVAYVGMLVVALRARGVARDALELVRIGRGEGPSDRPGWLRWWRTCLAAPIKGRGVEVHRNLAYVEGGDGAHHLDVMVARGGAPAHAPVMVFVHGGAWVVGSKRSQCLPMLYELAARGWVCVTINYRLSPKATWPDHIVDVKRAIAWTKANVAAFGGDPSRFLAVAGNSAGGQLAALAALTPNDPAFQEGFEDADTTVDACVSLYGVLEMTGDPAIQGRQGRALAALLARTVMKVGLADARPLYEAASPFERITASAPPFLVLHGTRDSLVPVNVARAFVERFERTATAPIGYVELPLAQHAYDLACSPRCSATVRAIAAFLEAQVRAATTSAPG